MRGRLSGGALWMAWHKSELFSISDHRADMFIFTFAEYIVHISVQHAELAPMAFDAGILIALW